MKRIERPAVVVANLVWKLVGDSWQVCYMTVMRGEEDPAVTFSVDRNSLTSGCHMSKQVEPNVVAVSQVGASPEGFTVVDDKHNKLVTVRCWCGKVLADERLHLIARAIDRDPSTGMVEVQFPNGVRIWAGSDRVEVLEC
jgi:hypothetical protein